MARRERVTVVTRSHRAKQLQVDDGRDCHVGVAPTAEVKDTGDCRLVDNRHAATAVKRRALWQKLYVLSIEFCKGHRHLMVLSDL
jgi:hypothetical protein